jgi:hypothetical protein
MNKPDLSIPTRQSVKGLVLIFIRLAARYYCHPIFIFRMAFLGWCCVVAFTIGGLQFPNP